MSVIPTFCSGPRRLGTAFPPLVPWTAISTPRTPSPCFPITKAVIFAQTGNMFPTFTKVRPPTFFYMNPPCPPTCPSCVGFIELFLQTPIPRKGQMGVHRVRLGLQSF